MRGNDGKDVATTERMLLREWTQRRCCKVSRLEARVVKTFYDTGMPQEIRKRNRFGVGRGKRDKLTAILPERFV
jgi:hypothetical protein